MSDNAPQGWYDDGSGKQRWWDGTQWTEHLADPVAPESENAARVIPEVSPAEPVAAKRNTRRNLWIIVGAVVVVLVLAIVGISVSGSPKGTKVASDTTHSAAPAAKPSPVKKIAVPAVTGKERG
jgi:hypothetical protein